MFFKGLRRAGGSSPGHLVTASLTVSLSLPLFLPFSLFSHPSFFATLLFPSFLSLYPLLFPNLFFFLPIFFSVSPFLTSFLYLAAFLDSFLLRSSPFQSLALSLSLHLSLLSFFTFFFFSFSLLFVFFFFCLGEGPPEGFFCNEWVLYIVYSLKAPLFKRKFFFFKSFSALGNALGGFGCKLGNS